MPKLLLSLLLIFQISHAQSSRVYVNVAATGANNGTSWADAYTDLQVAMDFAYYNYKDTVWVARGTYQNAVDPSFYPMENVKVFGGFTGSETMFEERDWRTNITILKGKTAHVIWCNNRGVTNAFILDGFTITGGTGMVSTSGGGMYIVYDSPLFRNCTITGNKTTGSAKGGGAWCQIGSPVFINCVFSNNEAAGGGGIASDEAYVTLINCVISGNVSRNTVGGGGLYMSTGGNLGSLTMVNCTVSGNRTPGSGGGFRLFGIPANISNSIFYGNHSDYGSTISVTKPATTTLTNCIVEGGYPGAGNMDVNPQFVNAPPPSTIPFATGDYRLRACSPAITAGDNSKLTVSIDNDELPRVVNSTVDIGAYEFQSLPESSSLANGNSNVSRNIYPGITLITVPGSCDMIAALQPNGGSTALSGDVSTKSWIDGSVQNWNGQYYVQRHYDISPATNAAAATARITLYCTQAEFDAFNLVSADKLPTGPSDAQGIANLRVWQFHGTSASGTPGSYSGSTETIDPVNADILWNSTHNYWQLSFDVTGFSGFALTAMATTLPLKLTAFNGRLQHNKVLLQWTTAGEYNTDHFELWRSFDGSQYESIGKLMAAGTGNNEYSFTDIGPGERNFYRLLMKDKDGQSTQSQIIQVRSTGIKQSTILYPNPTRDLVTISIGSDELLHTKAVLINAQGQAIRQLMIANNTETFSIAELPPGLYLLKLQNGETLRLVKQ
ncbi:T9SS type A sorting domain-containing protein [Pseudobacter ginsenosidimutans]|uniref:Putative secreted protein (Por secretion system target) n=1 Tax=Pseudobacter ginsenosidimutans TaxID=661488 RepID=A0A4V2F1M5_9BACT|nr:T9SS type A sorting domain-containing protein [Pseudobacter ginsenosidimutans]QEC42944.1 T9SS type A sorting domain-containing protein [Pseudobacter ginsenosidimutans]RZS74296.1 putative secreted protein (Por secretion system target) [Pseudobacter ginsenosidimutans]